MINTFELELYGKLNYLWQDLVTKLGTPQDYVPYIFANLPATGQFGANQQAITELFKDLSSDKPDHDRLHIILQYPAERAHIPCISIEVGEEQEQEAVGRYVYKSFNQANGKWEVQKGASFYKTYSIGVWSFNADTTLYLFSMTKYLMFLATEQFQYTGSAVLSARPLMIDFQRFQPDIVYFRYIDVRTEGQVDSAVIFYDEVEAVNVQDPSDTTYNSLIDETVIGNINQTNK